jgi:serine/threonine protein kinase/DNA-binding CsgD family transcriptional regulator
LADRRSLNREQTPHGTSTDFFQFTSREPMPEEALAAADELTAVLSQLGDRDRQVLELRLQGYEHEEIADRLSCSERTVRRAINQARRLMAARGGPQFVATAARKLPPSARSPRRASTSPVGTLDAPLRWTDFLLQQQIGAGATGKIYRAVHRVNGNEVAIKFLRKSLAGDAGAMSRFLSEARTVAALHHPGIVTVHGAGRTPGGGLFLMLDLIHGQNLEELRRQRIVNSPDAIRWIRDAALAVAFANNQGVIHCDLKPSNILLDDSGKVRVTDFGLAVHLQQPDGHQPLWAGTPAFMAPEQVDPCWGAISTRTDVWGLGSVLYFLLFGQPPHVAPELPGTLAAVVSKTPVRFLDSQEPIPSSVLDVLNRCLAKSPADRLVTACELANQLDALKV